MKLSTKTILLTIIISVLLISLSGCFLPTVPSPGYTPKDIIGNIETPKECCDTSKAHMPGWVPMVGATVILTDDSGKVTHTTTTEAEGKYHFTNVNPGLYIITAICPLNEEYLVKDVVDKGAGNALNAGITDCQSTALALVVEYLLDIYNEDNECFGKGTDVYEQVKRVAAEYESLNLEGIDLAAIKGIRPEFDADLVDMICYCLVSCCTAPEPGFTPEPEPEPEPEPTGGTPTPPPPPPPPPPNLCAYNASPVITDPSGGKTIPADEGKIFTYEVKAEDNPSQALTFSLDKSSLDRGMTIGGTITDGGDASKRSAIVTWEKPKCDCKVIAPTCSYFVTVTVEDVCHSTDTVTFIVEVTCKTYTLTMKVSPPGGGTTTPAVGTHTYPAGTVVSISASHAVHYEFANWTGDVEDPSLASTKVTMDDDKTVTAKFTRSSWTENDGLRVAFEDLPNLKGCNDWDYNDWVGDINIVYYLLGPDKLTGIDFTIKHIAHIASYCHKFHLIIPGGFGGTYKLNGSGVIPLEAGVDNDIEIIPDSCSASGDYKLKINYSKDVDFDYDLYKFDPVNIHGEGLFFEPVLVVPETPENIGKYDIRMLTVPLGWQYPAGQVRIWTVYDEVKSDGGTPCPKPVFAKPGSWTWTPAP